MFKTRNFKTYFLYIASLEFSTYLKIQHPTNNYSSELYLYNIGILTPYPSFILHPELNG